MIGNVANANTAVEPAVVSTTVEAAAAVEALQEGATEGPVVKESFDAQSGYLSSKA